MVLEVGALTQGPALDLFGPSWPLRAAVAPPDADDFCPVAAAARLQSPVVAKHSGKDRPAKRIVKAECDSTAAPCPAQLSVSSTSPTLKARSRPASPSAVRQPPPPPPPPTPRACQISPPATSVSTAPPSRTPGASPAGPATFSFTQIVAPVNAPFSFPPAATMVLAIRTDVVKRARPRSDVDGEHTAPLSSKKRRLRLHLITSRLSQPFCVPASHILNRDAIVSGDKRFLKLTSSAEASKHIPSVQSSLLHRAAVLNRVRLKARNEVIERGGGGGGGGAPANVPANAAVLYQTLSHFTGAKFVVSQDGLEGGIANQLAQQRSAPKMRMPAACPLPLATRHRPSPSPPGTPNMKAADGKTKSPLTSRVRPLSSPELRPQRPAVEGDNEMVDDEEVAFPTAAHESRYEPSDDPEEVYSDFSLIFGSAGDAIDDEEELDEHSYEEYLEELDGIPWLGL